MVGYEVIQTIGNATATYKFTPKYVLKAGQKVAVRADFGSASFSRISPRQARVRASLSVLFSDLGFGCWSERQTSHRFGVEESFILGFGGGRPRGADQPSGRGGEHTHPQRFLLLL